MNRVRAGASLAVLAAAASIVAGCGGAPIAGAGGVEGDSDEASAAKETYEKLLAMSGDERRGALADAAEKEGRFGWYTSMNDDIAKKIEQQFESEFDIDMEVYRAGSSTILTKITQEVRANAEGADVVDTNSQEMSALSATGALSEYTGEQRDKVSESGRFENWTASRYLVFAPSWNTDVVSEDEAPKTWEDLADPKWDGRMALELEDYDWYMALTMYWQDQGKSDEEITQLWEDIVDGAEVQKGHTAMADLHQAGKFDIATSNYTYIVEQKKRAGAHLEYLPLVESPLALASGIGMISNARHPACALLFTDWMLEEGQRLLYDEGLTGSIVPEGEVDPLAEANLVQVDDQELLDNSEKWQEDYQDLLRGAENGG